MSLRAIHEVMSSGDSLPDLDDASGSLCSRYPRGSTIACHVVCVWIGRLGVVGSTEVLEGLNTSSEPREFLGRGDLRVDGLRECSNGSIPEISFVKCRDKSYLVASASSFRYLLFLKYLFKWQTRVGN